MGWGMRRAGKRGSRTLTATAVRCEPMAFTGRLAFFVLLLHTWSARRQQRGTLSGSAGVT
ncbi:MAG: hypothetical protein OJF49_002469 [Ktedonobacterales bacterium]|nr:MAG: hypothetical protein OJF49_002469 [Ktedonobacterales bacterium]